MTWEPISEIELKNVINVACERMTPQQKQLWDIIKINPIKWQHEPWGNQGGGFWVVGIIGKKVIWYNDIEEGFNRSTYSVAGRIEEYWCNQDELEHSVQQIIDEIENGYDKNRKLSPF